MRKSKQKKKVFLGSLIKRLQVLVCILAMLTTSAGLSQASVTYTPLGGTYVTLSSVINDSYQSNILYDVFSEIIGASIPVNITATGIINSTNDGNAIYSSVFANNSTLSTDLALVSGSDPGSSLTSINAQENFGITAFSRVSASGVTTNIVNPFSASSVSISGNSISAETGLNRTSQTVDGNLSLTFDSSHDGTATLSTGSPVLSGDAGIFVGSGQINASATSGSSPAFARIDGADTVGLTVSGTLGDSLSLKADNNSISAAFTGNNARNLLSVETGGATSLTSSAGIANLQVNFDVSGDSAVIEAGSGISASVRDNRLESSSLSFDGNQLKASATGSLADNRLQVAEGLNIAADGAQTNSLDFTASSETATTSGGLFINNMQLAIDSSISATANDPAGSAASLSVDSRGLINSALTADGNSFEAIALGNDAYGSILVGGTTSFDSAVAASNLQALYNSPVSATANGGTLSVNLGGSPALVDVPENDIIGSAISVNNNTVSALAVGNRDPLLVGITGTTVTDGVTQTSGTSVNNGTQELSSTAGISAVSSQSAADSNVTASNTGAGINLAAGGYPVGTGAAGPHVSDDTFTQSGNKITSLANLNEGLVAVGIDANELDASTAVASVQNAATSNVTATTSGTITTGVNTRTSGEPTTPSNISILVGDGDLSDSVNTGNTISSTAGGNLNAAALEAMASTTIQVTNVIDADGAGSPVLSLSSGTAATNQTLAEMSVLTDQRLAANSISATTDYSQITGMIRISADPLSNSTLNVDGNQVAATARGNLTGNSLEFSALSVDMSAAEAGAPATPAGSNLASMGAVQVIGEESSVTATINAGAGIEILGRQAGSGDLTNIELSVDGNSVVAAATGNTATSSLKGSGGSLAQDVPGALAGNLSIAPLPATALTIGDVAVANAVIQSNAGTVAANLATTQNYQIIANTSASNTLTNNSKDITSSVITADNNSALALATGSISGASTMLDFNTLESSAATAVQQAQSGSTTATVGGAGGVTISAWTPLNTNLVNSTISASGNTAGAQATGATAITSLSAGGDNTVTMASGFGDSATDGASASIAAAGATSSSADYMLGVQQNISGVTSAVADDISVYAEGARFSGGKISADNNFLTAQAVGGASAAALSLNSNDMTAGGIAANTANAALSGDQRLSAAVSATLTESDVMASATNLTTSATGANSSEAISVNNNTLLASGTGVSSANELATNAITSVAGDSNGERSASISSGTVTGTEWDRMIVSNQDISATGTVTVSAADLGVSAAVTGADAPYSPVDGDNNGDSLSVDGNKLLAQGIGGSSSNILSTTTGTAITSLSQAVIANQVSAAAVTVSNFLSEAALNIADDSINSSLSLSGNQIASSATGLSGANTLSMSSAASITDDGALPSTNMIMSRQDLAETAAVSSSVTISAASLYVGGDAVGSSLKVEDNNQDAYAKGATSINTLIANSGSLGTSGTEGVGFAVFANQTSAAPVNAENLFSFTGLYVDDGSASGSSLSLSGNSASAVAGNLTGSNTMTVEPLTANIGDASALTLDTSLASPSAEADRLIVSSQTVAATGDVSSSVDSPLMEIYVYDELMGNSTAYLTGNRAASAATVAGNTNTLTNSAATLLTSSSLIGSVQSSGADATANVDYAEMDIYVYYPVIDSSVALSGNEVTATAAGLAATNTLNVTAGSIQGAFATGGIYSSAAGGNPNYHSITGLSAISSEQTTSGNISAVIQSPYLYVEAWDIINSAVDVKDNLIQASSTAASATNTLMQLADTSMADAPALIAASQTISGSSTATLTDGEIWAYSDGGVSASKISVDTNTIQAVAVGGTMINFLDPASGTSMVYSANPDPWVDTGASFFSGTYAVVSRQTSTATVSATLDDNPWIELEVDGDITGNSAVSASGNIMRAQATSLLADNTAITAAGTALDLVTTGVLSYQDVSGETSACISGADVLIEGYNLAGTAAADGNLIVALATGGQVINDLAVSALSITGDGPTNLETSSLLREAESGWESLASLLNVQTRSAGVSAIIDDGDGDIEISAELENVVGAVSVSRNLLAAEARGLVAVNSLDLSSETVNNGGSAALGSVQRSNADVTASIISLDSDSSIYISTYALTGTATLDYSTVLAGATANLAINSLTATAGIEMINLGADTTASIGIPVISETAGFALQNAQSFFGAAATSTITNFAIWTDINSLSGTATVDNNAVIAESRGNAAQNGLVLNAGTTLNSSASLVNAQSSWGGNISSGIAAGAISLTAGSVAGTTSVSGNTVQASSTSNLSLNSMDISGTLAASNGGSTGAMTATADYAALNYQSNIATTVSSSVSDFSISLNNSSTDGAAGVLNNAILANATGNSSVNSFTIGAVGGSNTADFAFNGYQGNIGSSVSSSISGASISLTSNGGTGTFGVNGNRIGATATGNVSVSSVKSGRR